MTNGRVRSVSVITPCRNAQRYIEETARSVLEQTAVRSGRVKLEYLVCDGGSDDRTIEILEQLARDELRIVSRNDAGMYDGLAKGLAEARGEIVSYLNAGDYYHPTALDVVLDVMEDASIAWITGLNIVYNDRSQVVTAVLPYRYRRGFLARGLYDGRTLPFVQQESTFWHCSLLDTVDLQQLARLQYAGDAYLWCQFAQAAELTIVSAYLGGFRSHPGQASERRDEYHREMRQVCGHPKPLDWLLSRVDWTLWRAPRRIKKKLNPRWLRIYDHDRGIWI